MKTKIQLWCMLAGDLLLLFLLVIAPVEAQEDNTDRAARLEERREMMEQRRAEYLENNPEAAAQFEEREAQRQQRREEYLANNPDAAGRFEGRGPGNRNFEGRGRPPRDGRPGPRRSDESTDE